MLTRRSLFPAVAAAFAGLTAIPAMAGDFVAPSKEEQRARVWRTAAPTGKVANGNQGDFELDSRKGYATADKGGATAPHRKVHARLHASQTAQKATKHAMPRVAKSE